MSIKKYYLISLLIPIFIQAHSVYIIIHGTWAFKYPWHMPHGDFFDAVEYSKLPKDSHVISFMWSGNIDHESRNNAALSLVKLIQSYPPTTYINLISHSHGSNVGILASQHMANDSTNKHLIYTFYALGTPVHCQSYMPNMQVIRYFYNFFSYDDLVQPCLGIFDREYPLHERIANIRITINGKQPSHAELHSPIVGRWLVGIHEIYQKSNSGNFETFFFKQPGLIHFYQDKPPLYERDIEREQLCRLDKQYLQQIQMGVIDQVMRSSKK
jgi:hypothetical protein